MESERVMLLSTLESHLHSLAGLWTDLIRVMDDVKKSVRVAAGKTDKSLFRSQEAQ